PGTPGNCRRVGVSHGFGESAVVGSLIHEELVDVVRELVGRDETGRASRREVPEGRVDTSDVGGQPVVQNTVISVYRIEWIDVLAIDEVHEVFDARRQAVD